MHVSCKENDFSRSRRSKKSAINLKAKKIIDMALDAKMASKVFVCLFVTTAAIRESSSFVLQKNKKVGRPSAQSTLEKPAVVSKRSNPSSARRSIEEVVSIGRSSSSVLPAPDENTVRQAFLESNNTADLTLDGHGTRSASRQGAAGRALSSAAADDLEAEPPHPLTASSLPRRGSQEVSSFQEQVDSMQPPGGSDLDSFLTRKPHFCKSCCVGPSPSVGSDPLTYDGECLDVAKCSAASSKFLSSGVQRKYALISTIVGNNEEPFQQDDLLAGTYFPNFAALELARQNILKHDREESISALDIVVLVHPGRIAEKQEQERSGSTSAGNSHSLVQTFQEKLGVLSSHVVVKRVPWVIPPEAKYDPGEAWAGPKDFIRLHAFNETTYDAVAYYDNDVELQDSGENLLALFRCVDAQQDLLLTTTGGLNEPVSVGFFAVKPRAKILDLAMAYSKVANYDEKTGWGRSGWTPAKGYFVGGEAGQGFFLSLFYHPSARLVQQTYKEIGLPQSAIKAVSVDRCQWNYQTNGFGCEVMKDHCLEIVAHHKPGNGNLQKKGAEFYADDNSVDISRGSTEPGEVKDQCLKRGYSRLLAATRGPAQDQVSRVNHSFIQVPEDAKAAFFVNVFYYIEDPKDRNQLAHFLPAFPLLAATWEAHFRGTVGNVYSIEPRLTLVTDANVRTFIPDMPDEFDRLPDAQSKSDLIRYALLYGHGGIYLDTDFLVQRDIHPRILLSLALSDEDRDRIHSDDAGARNVVPGIELFSYEYDGQRCRGAEDRDFAPKFSSNFLGATKGSQYMKRVWEEQKQAVAPKAVCDTLAADQVESEPICCGMDPTKNCHISFGSLGEGTAHTVPLKPATVQDDVDPLKLQENEGPHEKPLPADDSTSSAEECTTKPVTAEGMTQFVIAPGIEEVKNGETEAGRDAKTNVVTCFRGDEHLAPFHSKSLALDASTSQSSSKSDIQNLQRTPNARCRTAYHMFASLGAPEDLKTAKCVEGLNGDSLFAEVLTRSLNNPDAETVKNICARESELFDEDQERAPINNALTQPAAPAPVLERKRSAVADHARPETLVPAAESSPLAHEDSPSADPRPRRSPEVEQDSEESSTTSGARTSYLQLWTGVCVWLGFLMVMGAGASLTCLWYLFSKGKQGKFAWATRAVDAE
ncbi:unnamed protein product [Amoebophrya sp. A120]|nr:unnamed protein product [Amoebophrya sp. A120]|eukprot:GSA120T00006498001.1